MDLDAAIEQHNVLTTLINAKVAKLVEHINEVIEANCKVNGYVKDTKAEAVTISNKWIRIDRVDSGRSAYAFVARADGETKMLGKIKAGDIHMAASFKAPAKHARGNLFEEITWTCCGPYGVARLR
jgi:hypothetical protein